MKPFREIGHFVKSGSDEIVGFLVGECKSNGALSKRPVGFVNSRTFSSFVERDLVQCFTASRKGYSVQLTEEERKFVGYLRGSEVTQDQYFANDRTFILQSDTPGDCLYLCATNAGKVFGHMIVRMTYWHTTTFSGEQQLKDRNVRGIHLARQCANYGTITGEVNLVMEFLEQIPADVSLSTVMLQNGRDVALREDAKFLGKCSDTERLTVVQFLEQVLT